ncbi:hypothetical protein [Cytobacillus firmus]|uniref:hypothetical protein n=1 Tax=Cytobacillus firmus TaxID=1399 RepID=UPI0018CCCF18|nr:hypothetical protein [Cytobacillus firmus]MED1907147.1 hypothetical protein [Cytobacillus firmus]
MSSLKLWTLLQVCFILLIPIRASAEESCSGIKKGQKIWWDGVELKPGQIGRLTVARDTYLYKPEGEFKVTARVLKAGEKYRIYAFKPGMLSVGDGLYVDRDAKVKYETPSKGKLSNLKCANPDWYKPAPSPVKPPNDETEEETPSPKPQEPAEPMTWKLEYKGKQNVTDRELAPYDLKNLNTYELKFETGYPQ